MTYKPDKLEKHRTRLTVGGDRLTCLIDPGTPTADVPTIKLLRNSTLSIPGAKYTTMSISNFYLDTPMERPEYMQMPLKIILQEIIYHYKLTKMQQTDGCTKRLSAGCMGFQLPAR